MSRATRRASPPASTGTTRTAPAWRALGWFWAALLAGLGAAAVALHLAGPPHASVQAAPAPAPAVALAPTLPKLRPAGAQPARPAVAAPGRAP